MAERILGSGTQARPTLKDWLVNPFIYVAGGKALVLGLGAILLSACLGFLSRTHFDGILDVHTGRPAPLSAFIFEGISDWLILSIVLLIVGKMVSRTSFRVVDVVGTQALARWPLLLVSLVALAPPYQRASAALARQISGGDNVLLGGTDKALAGVIMLFAVIALIWMVALMYRAYSLCCNVKGGRGVVSFVVALIAAEVILKVAVLRLLAG